MDDRPIGVFDSGLGGLTTVRQLRKLMPAEDIVYFGDTGRVPYGTRSREMIVQYTRQDIRFLLSQNVKFIIAACGTVSSTYPAGEAAQLPVPYTGVVRPAVAAAVAAAPRGRVGVIATSATIRSGRYQALLQQQRPDAFVLAKACPLFVPLVENGYVQPDNPVTRLVAEDYLAALQTADLDTLILGCTHYPHIAPIIGALMGTQVRLIDSGLVTAQFAKDELQRQGLASRPDRTGTARFYVSDSVEQFAAAEELFMGRYAGGPVEQIAIETY